MQDLISALRQESTFNWNGRAFTWTYQSTFGSEIDCAATPDRMRAAIRASVTAVWPDAIDENIEGFTAYLNGLIDDAESAHELGEIVERRSSVVDTTTLFTGAGKRTRHEALIRLAADWIDPRGQFPVQRKAGDDVWIETAAPAERV